MKRVLAPALAASLLIPAGVTAQTEDPWAQVHSMVPAAMDADCQDYGAREMWKLVGLSVAGIQCDYLGPEKVNDFSLFLFDEEWGLYDLWKERKGKRVGNAAGGCAENREGVVRTARGELICYKSGGKARIRWIDEEYLLYGALDTDWGRVDYAYDWWRKNLEPVPPGAVRPQRPWELRAGDPITVASQPANQAFGGFRQTLVDALAETRARLAAASVWIEDPDWYLQRTPDTGIVAVRLSRLPDHAALLADPDFAARAGLLDDPVHAWDEEFTMALGLIADEARTDRDPVAAAERLAASLPQTSSHKKWLFQDERKALRADGDALVAAIDDYDLVLAAIGIEPAPVAAAEIQPAPAVLPHGPIDLVTAFRDGLVADRASLQERISACRAAIDSETMVAFGEPDGLSSVATLDLLTWPGYAYFFEFLRERGVGWSAFEPAAAEGTSLRAALARFQRWQDWPAGQMRHFADKQVATRFDFATAKEDRAVCRPEIELLQPERDRLDAAIATLDEYLTQLALAAEPEPEPEPTPTPAPTPKPTPEPQAEASETPAPNPFADL